MQLSSGHVSELFSTVRAQSKSYNGFCECVGNVSPPAEHRIGLEPWEPHWSPCDPKDCLCHYLLPGTCLISCPGTQVPSTSQSWAGHLRLPSPFGDAEPLVVNWHHWCWDDKGNLHLVYCCSSVRLLSKPLLCHSLHESKCYIQDIHGRDALSGSAI